MKLACPNLTKLLSGRKLNPARQTLRFLSIDYSDQCHQGSCCFVVEESEVSVMLEAGQSSMDLVGFGDVPPPQPPEPQGELADQLLGDLQSPGH